MYRCMTGEMRMLSSPRMHAWRLLSFCLALAAASCASVPVATVVPSAPAPPPDITPEEKLAWVIRLEDQRILKDPSPPPPALLQPATVKTPAVYALPAPSDLIPMLRDSRSEEHTSELQSRLHL